jgi:hypothetical protein
VIQAALRADSNLDGDAATRRGNNGHSPTPRCVCLPFHGQALSGEPLQSSKCGSFVFRIRVLSVAACVSIHERGLFGLQEQTFNGRASILRRSGQLFDARDEVTIECDR